LDATGFAALGLVAIGLAVVDAGAPRFGAAGFAAGGFAGTGFVAGRLAVAALDDFAFGAWDVSFGAAPFDTALAFGEDGRMAGFADALAAAFGAGRAADFGRGFAAAFAAGLAEAVRRAAATCFGCATGRTAGRAFFGGGFFAAGFLPELEARAGVFIPGNSLLRRPSSDRGRKRLLPGRPQGRLTRGE
jgi:hypothetical protein